MVGDLKHVIVVDCPTDSNVVSATRADNSSYSSFPYSCHEDVSVRLFSSRRRLPCLHDGCLDSSAAGCTHFGWRQAIRVAAQPGSIRLLDISLSVHVSHVNPAKTLDAPLATRRAAESRSRSRAGACEEYYQRRGRLMASWQNVPGLPAPIHDGGGFPSSLGSLDMGGMLDGSGNVGMMNGLDMDMSLPMDLDMDNYNPMQSQSTSNAGSGPQDQKMAMNAGNGMYTSQSQQPDGNGMYNTQTQQPETQMTGAGAGPLPTGFGMPAQANSSTLTEFTKRRNWSQRIIEELKDFLHILTPDGRILYVSPSCKAITGYEPQTLIGKFIGELVHPDDSGIFMREFNESIASGNSLRFFYRFKKEDSTYMIFECDGHPHISSEPANMLGSNQSPDNNTPPVSGHCRGFFMMARPYPTKNAALLDSFLEHKIENERLMKRIDELKREEVQENAEQDRVYREHVTSQAGATPTESNAGNSRAAGEGGSEPPTDYQGMPPPAKPPISNTALTRQNLDSALSSQKPDSIADKMSRYEANSTHLESIELLTGLRYRDGERSHGISTGDTSPALIRGDAGIAILLDRDRDGIKKDKKKLKVADEYVCADCGTLDSPEWRKGPKGPKTLCNACGLRWAKKEKKRTGEEVKNDSPVHAGGGMQVPGAPGVLGGGMVPGGPTAQGMGIAQPPSMPMQTSTGSSG